MSTLVNQKAPDFTARAVMPDGSIKPELKLGDYRSSYVVLIFYPLDFTFICPSEIIAHSNRLGRFAQLGVQLIGVSIDSQFTHLAWRETPVERGGIGRIGFPLVAGVNHAIVKAYGIEHPDGVGLRASILIDRQGMVQHQVVNNLPLGRDVEEMLRMVEALQFTEQHGEVCPAGWRKGERGMQPSPQGVADFLAENADRL
ncbi:MAG: peroxiredoxin [Gammaproteobacteria bacterium]